MPDHLLRIRLKRGRNTHAARLIHGDESDYTMTACGHMVVPGDTHLDGNPPVDCRECKITLRRNDS